MPAVTALAVVGGRAQAVPLCYNGAAPFVSKVGVPS